MSSSTAIDVAPSTKGNAKLNHQLVDATNKLPSRTATLPKERGRTTSAVALQNPTHAWSLPIDYWPCYLPMERNTSPVLPGEVQGYVQLQRQIHEALLKEHPEWIEPNGECPMCEIYESRLAELLALASSSEYRSAA
jgi:hypothetical protein